MAAWTLLISAYVIAGSFTYAEEDIWSAFQAELLKMTSADVPDLNTTDDDSERVVCYENVGCFSKDHGTFRHVRLVPESPEKILPYYVFYTRSSLASLGYDEVNRVAELKLDPSLPVKVLIHGFGGIYQLPWMQEIKNAFLRKAPMNVILINWSEGARPPHYFQSATNTELVGRLVARLLGALKEKVAVPASAMHLIGFSLGAQVAGFAGSYYEHIYGHKIARITGLDAAGPLFEKQGDTVHLDSGDAEFVDGVHTNGESMIVGGVGMKKAYGHVDFYPNGGKRQPGCPSTIFGSIKDIFSGKREKVCNHERATILYLESIEGCHFPTFTCPNDEYSPQDKCSLSDCMAFGTCGRMGYEPLGRGIHFTATRVEAPYCANIFMVEVYFSKGMPSSRGELFINFKDAENKLERHSVAGDKRRMVAGEYLRGIVASSFSPNGIKSATLTYVKATGWILKGTETIQVDRIEITHSDGLWVRNCNPTTVVTTGVELDIDLVIDGSCDTMAPSS